MNRSAEGTGQVSLRAPEILAPAGGREAFLGALRAGADAFYLGGQRFGARAYAQNFTEEEIVLSLEEAHLLGRRIYLTANVLTRQDELADTVAFVDRLACAGLDGVIVQDMGILRALHRNCPGLPLHASTQMSVTGPEAAGLLRELGVSRVVPARELTLEEVRTLKKESGMEVESFIHGAMCYSYSGRCLFSSFLGGRSGNRGRCAGTCRLPYRVLDENGTVVLPAGPARGEAYPLSMRDMCTLPMLPLLIEAGIDSFKIEGRMKKPEYAAGVTALYRKYTDLYLKLRAEGRPEAWKVSREDLEELNSLYIRTERSEGYYRTAPGQSLVTLRTPGYAGTDEDILTRIRERWLTAGNSSAEGGRLIDGEVYLSVGGPSRLTVRTVDEKGPRGEVTVTGDTVQQAKSRPLSKEEVRRRLGRTGDTFFYFRSLQIDMEEGVFLPVSRLQELRRSALSALREQILLNNGTKTGRTVPSGQIRVQERADNLPQEPGRKQQLITQVLTEEQFTAAVRAGADAVLMEKMMPASATDNAGIPLYLVLPHVYRVRDRSRIQKAVEEACRRDFRGIMVRTLEELSLVESLKEEGIFNGEILADSSLYAWNAESAAFLLEHCGGLVLPEEAGEQSLQQIEAGFPSSRLIRLVYGRVPLMITAGCLRRTAGQCPRKDLNKNVFWHLSDRRGKDFPTRLSCGECCNIIYNSVPLSLHGKLNDAGLAQAGKLLCTFSVEGGTETEGILRYFRNPDSSPVPEQIRMREYTAGHYRKGAL